MNFCPFAGAPAYLERVPEKLVVEGFRSWIAGYQTGDIARWDEVWNLFATTLGSSDGRLALNLLSEWVKSIWLWHTEPVRIFPPGCLHICRDECLAAATIAACQNDDPEALRYCLERMGGVAGSIEVLEASVAFANGLRGMDQRLLRVPCPVLRQLLEQPKRTAYH